MQKMPAFLAFMLVASAFLLVLPVAGALEEQVVLYQTDFSADPHWITNGPSYYFWDVANGSYHFETEGGTNGYAYIPVDIGDDPFLLEYDVTFSFMQPDSALRFGLTSSEMDITRGTVVLSEFDANSFGHIMALKVIDPNNHLYQKTSQYQSYCGEQPNCYTKQFDLNTTYHVTLRYNDQMNQADIKITEKATGNLVWGYFVGIGSDVYSLNRLAITTKGDYMVGNAADGSIDNVVVYTYRPVPETTLTTVPTTVPTTTPPTTVPTTTPTPTKSAGGFAAISTAAAMAGGVFLFLGRKRP